MALFYINFTEKIKIAKNNDSLTIAVRIASSKTIEDLIRKDDITKYFYQYFCLLI